MPYVTTSDGVDIFYKDWGPKDAQPMHFHHGWPLSADDWDNQMLFFLQQGYRVVAHDRRGHGRSEQVGDGHDMDHYAADASAVAEHLDLKNAIHIGHSTGGGQVARYVMGSAKAHYEGIKAFSETDQTEDLKAITVPTLVLAGDDDQVVPYKTGALMQDKLLQNSKLIIHPGFSHGMLTVNADVVNADILAFIKG
jgi:pimeloyl-ACP methyl ester carboxylesterase